MKITVALRPAMGKEALRPPREEGPQILELLHRALTQKSESEQ